MSVDWLQVLDPEGNVDKSLEPPLDDGTLEKFYRTMVLTRLFDDKALKLQRQGRMLTFGSSLGQEATAELVQNGNHIFNKPTVAICPKGFHLLLITRWVDRPYAFFVICLSGEHDSPWVEA